MKDKSPPDPSPFYMVGFLKGAIDGIATQLTHGNMEMVWAYIDNAQREFREWKEWRDVLDETKGE